METMIEVANLDELKLNMDSIWRPHSLTCKHYCYDDRIQWDTWIIIGDGSVLGFSDRKLE